MTTFATINGAAMMTAIMRGGVMMTASIASAFIAPCGIAAAMARQGLLSGVLLAGSWGAPSRVIMAIEPLARLLAAGPGHLQGVLLTGQMIVAAVKGLGE